MATTVPQQGQGADGERFFAEFPYPTYEEWRAEVERTLKGASFERKLIKQTYEGISTKPLYVQTDIADLKHLDSLPGFTPYVRSTHTSGYVHTPWLVAQELPYPTPQAFNEALRADIERGQTAANLPLDQASRAGLDPDQAEVGAVGSEGVSLATVDDLAAALEQVDLTQIPVLIEAGASSLSVAALLVALLRRQGRNVAQVRGAIGGDPLGTLAATGTLPTALEQTYAEMAALTTWVSANSMPVATIEVRAHPYANGGAHAVQELAFAVATGVDYIRAMQERGLEIDTIAPHIRFSFSIGSNFFMEIAKLRAARLIWSRIVAAFGGNPESQKMYIHARTSRYNKTRADVHVNMLRTTTEAFAAALGGCDSMHVSPFDEPLRLPDQFSRRIARNTQLILQHEANLVPVIDPAGGSWYLESLTDDLARRGWALFQEVEKQGGMLAALQAGFPQQQVADTAAARTKNLASRKDVLLGTNMYPNLAEKPLDTTPPDYAALHRERSAALAAHRTQGNTSDDAATLTKLSQMMRAGGADLVETAVAAASAGASLGELTRTLRANAEAAPQITPVPQQRLAEPFEQLRANAEAHKAKTGTRPQVFLANMGPLVQHKARADFTSGFLAVGGFESQYPAGFDTPEAAVKAALDSGAPVVVICSTDDTYPDLVPPIARQLKAAKPDMIVMLAGYPQDQVEAHKAAGVDEFIHLRANCYNVLKKLQEQIGVAA